MFNNQYLYLMEEKSIKKGQVAAYPIIKSKLNYDKFSGWI